MYLDDSVALAALKLLKRKFPTVGGFQSVLLVYHPEQRERNIPIAAELFHCRPFNHYVAAVLLSSDVVLYIDSLKPGGKPSRKIVEQIEVSFNPKNRYCIRSALCQAQKKPDCLVFAIANLDAILSGNDISKVNFYSKTLRGSLVRSLVQDQISFPFQRCKKRGDSNNFSKRLGCKYKHSSHR